MRNVRIVLGTIAAAFAIGAYCIVVPDSAERQIAQKDTPVSSAHERVVHDVRQQAASSDVALSEAAPSAATEFGFKLMPNGELVIDDDTRDVVAEVAAVGDVSELREIKDHLQRALPSPAGESAADLVERYYQYRIALAEQLRSDEMAEPPQDPRIRLEALQALRTAFFGAEVAGLWFGKDEAISREVIARDARTR